MHRNQFECYVLIFSLCTVLNCNYHLTQPSVTRMHIVFDWFRAIFTLDKLLIWYCKLVLTRYRFFPHLHITSFIPYSTPSTRRLHLAHLKANVLRQRCYRGTSHSTIQRESVGEVERVKFSRSHPSPLAATHPSPVPGKLPVVQDYLWA